LLWDVLINRHTSDASDFAAMIAPLSALSKGNSRSPRAKARSKPSSEGTGGLHSAGLGTPAQTSPIATCHLPHDHPAGHAGAGGAVRARPVDDIRWVTDPKVKPLELFADGKIDAFLAFPPQTQDLPGPA
jgi:hypothetical protein